MDDGGVRGTNSEYVDVAFDGAFVRREDVDCERGVEFGYGAGFEWGVGNWDGRGHAEKREESSEECEFHREESDGNVKDDIL